jgi:hypothetical protein
MNRRRIPTIEGLEARQLMSVISPSGTDGRHPAEVRHPVAHKTTLGPRGRDGVLADAVSEGTKA